MRAYAYIRMYLTTRVLRENAGGREKKIQLESILSAIGRTIEILYDASHFTDTLQNHIDM